MFVCHLGQAGGLEELGWLANANFVQVLRSERQDGTVHLGHNLERREGGGEERGREGGEGGREGGTWIEGWSKENNLLAFKMEEIVCLIDEEYLQCSTRHVEPSGVDLSQLVQRDLEVLGIPCGGGWVGEWMEWQWLHED